MLTRLKLAWLQFRVDRLKRRIGNIHEVALVAPHGKEIPCHYIGLNYHHPEYPKYERLNKELERRTTWDVDSL